MKHCRLAILISLVVLMVGGCTERSSDYTAPELQTGDITPGRHVFFDELLVQIRNDEYQLLSFDYFSPEGYFTDLNKRAPYLILLAPEGQGEKFYFQHGLKELANELIASGEIEPMVIFCIENNPVFGGFFYAGSSYPAGLYDDLMGDALIEWIDETLGGALVLAGNPAKRGIGGFGMGAYGAYRAALLSGKYGSVSGVDGPMDFDGADGNSGLIDLMDSVFVEQPCLEDYNFRFKYHTLGNPVSCLFVGGALAFSPHDLDLDSLLSWVVYQRMDGSEYRIITIDSTYRGLLPHIIMDSTTLIENVINEDARNFDFHMPFSYGTRPYQGPDSIWARWMDENLDSLLMGANMDSVDCWLGTSPEAKWGYHAMTSSWAQTLLDANMNPTVVTFEGYGDRPATNSQYVYDMMKEMLIFHSNSFKK